MTNLSFCLKRLAPHIDEKFMCTSKPDSVLGIKILDGPSFSGELSSDYVYLGDVKDIMAAAMSYKGSSIITMITTHSDNRSDFVPVSKVNFIATDYNLASLYNQVSSVLEVYSNWDRIITDTLYKDEGIHGLISRCGEFLDAQVMLFNNGYHLLAGSFSKNFTSHFASEVILSEYLCYNTVLRLEERLAECGGEKDNFYHFIPSDEDTEVFIRRIFIDGHAVATLMLIMNEVPEEYDMMHLTNQMVAVIKSLSGQNATSSMVVADKLGSLIADIHERRNISPIEITNRLTNLEYPLRKFIRCIIINFTNPAEDFPYEEVQRKVSFLFGHCNTTLYKKTIIVIYSDDIKTHQIPEVLYHTDFNALLEEYHAVAVVSNSIRHFGKFEPIYVLCRRLSKILRSMSFSSSYGRVYPYNEFSIYLSIDFATRQFQLNIGSTDIVLLADPAIVTLHRYDRDHNSNLCDVLLTYLSHGRSITQTANTLFMHRNTVQNKISKISQLISLDLADGTVQQRLLYSCQIIKYFTEFLGQDII